MVAAARTTVAAATATGIGPFKGRPPLVVGTGMLAARITGTARRGVSLGGLGAVLEQRVGLLRGPSTLLARQGLLLLERGHGGSGEAWPQMFGYIRGRG